MDNKAQQHVEFWGNLLGTMRTQGMDGYFDSIGVMEGEDKDFMMKFTNLMQKVWDAYEENKQVIGTDDERFWSILHMCLAKRFLMFGLQLKEAKKEERMEIAERELSHLALYVKEIANIYLEREQQKQK